MNSADKLSYVLFALLYCAHTSAGLKGVASSEYDLFRDLFANYSKTARPVANWNDKLAVNVKLGLTKIANVIENHQTISIYVRMELTWLDVNLVWDPKKYNNLESVVLPADKLWIPDLHLFNSANEDDRIYPVNVEVFANGTVQSYPINHLYAHCDFDFSRFPYDSQKCDFLIGSMIDNSKVVVLLKTFGDSSKVVPNPEWKFVRLTDSSSWLFNIPGTNQATKEAFNLNWSVAKFSLIIKRSSTFYVNLFVWPLIFILFITMSIFILPPNCVERTSMGALLLLTLVIMSLMLESYTPKTSASLSIIGKLIGFNMFMVTWATVVGTLITSIEKDNFVYRNIPQWLKNIMINVVAKIICKHETIQATLGGTQLSEEDIEILDTNQILQQQQQNRQGSSQPAAEQADLMNIREGPSAVSVDLSQAQTLLVLINNQLAMMRMRLQEKDLKDRNKKEWYLIASALDRLCLIIYVVILLFTFVVFI